MNDEGKTCFRPLGNELQMVLCITTEYLELE